MTLMPLTDRDVVAWLERFAAAVAASQDELTRLDAAIGDADHGANLHRGMQAVVARLPAAAGQDVGALFKTVAMTLISTVGGASGALYGTLFLQMGTAAAGKAELSPDEWATALQAGVNGVAARGKASPGDKTMLDVLVPAVDALRAALAAGATLPAALHDAARAGDQGAAATIPLVARKGRASYLGERSAGHQDPGATSAAMLLRAAAEVMNDA